MEWGDWRGGERNGTVGGWGTFTKRKKKQITQVNQGYYWYHITVCNDITLYIDHSPVTVNQAIFGVIPQFVMKSHLTMMIKHNKDILPLNGCKLAQNIICIEQLTIFGIKKCAECITLDKLTRRGAGHFDGTSQKFDSHGNVVIPRLWNKSDTPCPYRTRQRICDFTVFINISFEDLKYPFDF